MRRLTKQVTFRLSQYDYDILLAISANKPSALSRVVLEDYLRTTQKRVIADMTSDAVQRQEKT